MCVALTLEYIYVIVCMQYSYTRVFVCVVLYVILRRILTLSITLNL